MIKFISNYLLGFIFFCLMLVSCFNPNQKNEFDGKKEIIRTDKAFSNMSKQHGMKKAFIEYIDNDGVLLRPNHLPIVGADAIDYLSQANDSSYTLTWKPSSAHISASGDLGFSYGVYTLQLKDTALKGTYVSIWKKQIDGKWKFVLDSGNEGINNPADSGKSLSQ